MTVADTPAFVTRLDGPPVEQHIAHDMVRRALPVIPVVLVVALLIGGIDSALSVGFGIGLALANFVISAAMLAWAARISIGLLMGVALGGYLVRLGLITTAVLLVKDLGWVQLVPLCLALLVAHLGLLAWEARFVSTSLAFPGLKPPARNPSSKKSAPQKGAR